MRLGVIGGTFDPPHYAHLILAEFAREQLALDRVWWVVAADPPHKHNRPLSPVVDRIEMVRRVVRTNRAFDISLVELGRPGPHYTVETLAIIHQQVDNAELVLLLGADSLRDLPTWHRPSRLAELAHLGVMRRPGVSFHIDELEKSISGIKDVVDFLDAPLIDISSSQIRERLAAGLTIRYLLPTSVEDYIFDHHLYTA